MLKELQKGKLQAQTGFLRITASRLYAVFTTSMANSSRSLIKVICYPQAYSFKSKATTWGCKKEKIAKEKYKELMTDQHIQLLLSASGIFTSINEPHLAATPD